MHDIIDCVAQRYRNDGYSITTDYIQSLWGVKGVKVVISWEVQPSDVEQNSNDVGSQDNSQSADQHMDAMDKITPKKILGDISTLEINCPSCLSNNIYYIVDDQFVEYNYCPDCGQALDWSV